MNSPKCPRCGGEDFLELEQHHVEYFEELEENKTIYTKPLKCLSCDFEFVPQRRIRDRRRKNNKKEFILILQAMNIKSIHNEEKG